MTDTILLWQIRHFVYNHFAETTHPPSVDDAAIHFNLTIGEASEYYKELHNRHAFFLEPGTLSIRMANPFSGIPTDYKVHNNGKTYSANCAWDMFGIAAALHTDSVIEAVCTESKENVKIEIKDGKIANSQSTNYQFTISQLLIHFPLPFARWYDDLVFT